MYIVARISLLYLSFALFISLSVSPLSFSRSLAHLALSRLLCLAGARALSLAQFTCNLSATCPISLQRTCNAHVQYEWWLRFVGSLN